MNHFPIQKIAWRMNRIHLCFLSVLISSIGVSLYAQYLSGKFDIITPNPSSVTSLLFDFSEVDDSCSFFANNLCSIIVADAEIMFSKNSSIDTLFSNYGVLDLGLFDTSGFTQIGKVPLDGYINKTTIQLHHIYAIKTSEDHYAAIFYKEYIIGGIDTHVYWWAYQGNGSNDLTPPSSIMHQLKPINNHSVEEITPKRLIHDKLGNPDYNKSAIYNIRGQKYSNFFSSPQVLLLITQP